MVSTRNLGGMSDADVQSNQIADWWFIKVEFPSPVGTKYFTDRWTGLTGYFALDMGDGTGSHNWVEYDFARGPIEQNTQDVLNVSWIRFQNVDRQWTQWAKSPGVRGVAVTIWVVHFQITAGVETDTVLGKSILHYGSFDDGEYSTYAQIVLKPVKTPWASDVPFAEIGAACPYRFKHVLTCQYAGTDTNCGHFRSDCVAKGNQLNFGGDDLAPPIGNIIHWAGIYSGN